MQESSDGVSMSPLFLSSGLLLPPPSLCLILCPLGSMERKLSPRLACFSLISLGFTLGARAERPPFKVYSTAEGLHLVGGKFESILPSSYRLRSWGWHFLDLQSRDGEWWIPASTGLWSPTRWRSFWGWRLTISATSTHSVRVRTLVTLLAVLRRCKQA